MPLRQEQRSHSREGLGACRRSSSRVAHGRHRQAARLGHHRGRAQAGGPGHRAPGGPVNTTLLFVPCFNEQGRIGELLRRIQGVAPPIDELDRKSTRLNSSHSQQSRMPSSA